MYSCNGVPLLSNTGSELHGWPSKTSSCMKKARMIPFLEEAKLVWGVEVLTVFASRGWRLTRRVMKELLGR